MNIEQRIVILKTISFTCTSIIQYARAVDKCWENMKWQLALHDNPERQSNAAMLNLIVAEQKFLEMERLIQKVKNLADVKHE